MSTLNFIKNIKNYLILNDIKKSNFAITNAQYDDIIYS